MISTESGKCHNGHCMVEIESSVFALLASEIKNLSMEEQFSAVEELANITKQVLEEECCEGAELRREDLVRRVAALAFVTTADAAYGVSLSERRGDFSIGLNDKVRLLVTT